MTKFFNSTNVALTTWRHVRQFKFYKSELIFYRLSYNQSKTGVRMLLTSQIKELGAILQKLIKTWIDPGQQKR